MSEAPITFIGNLVSDPELRFTQSGTPVANFRMASSKAQYNRDTQQWEDGPSTFLSVSAWKQLAEHVTESLHKGMRVVVHGNLEQRNYEDKEGNKRSYFDIRALDVAASVKFGTLQFSKSSGGNQNNSWSNNSGGGQQPNNDPWNSQPQGGFGNSQDQPPF